MPQVHVDGARYRVRENAIVGAIQAYTGLPTPEIRRLAGRVAAGERVSVRLEDVDAAYNLASELAALGLNAEPDEADD